MSVIALSIPYFGTLSRLLPPGRRSRLRTIIFLLVAVFVVVFAHTVQVWAWAVTFRLVTPLADMPTSFYFATVTYTTLGYGDIVLDAGARIMATFCAITGLLTFGISTAFLIGVLSRMLPDVFGEA